MSNSNQSDLIINAISQGAGSLSFSFQAKLNGTILRDGYEFLWDFGDGNESEFPEPVHTYASTGNYDVSVTVVEEGDGKEGTDKSGSSTKDSPPPAKSALKTVSTS